jgi:hypothetical protein
MAASPDWRAGDGRRVAGVAAGPRTSAGPNRPGGRPREPRAQLVTPTHIRAGAHKLCTGPDLRGRYWDRTSDLFGVNGH